MAKAFDLKDDSVVVVVGSGAGGGTLSNELAQRGIDVVCLEAGPRLDITNIVNDNATMFSRLSWLDKRIGTGDLNAALPLWVCKTVGGTTVHWAGASLRFQEHEFRARTVYGNIPGANLLDWPITLQELEPFYTRAEDKLGVTGTHNIPRLPGNNNFKVMAAGAKRVGYTQVHTGNMAINAESRDGRPACQQIGFCMSGCAIGAKWSTLYTEIPKAESTGHFEIRPDSMVVKINHDASGKVTGVVYADKSGTLQEQKARVVCVAGNSVETPRLLLNSESSKFPNGLANSSGQVGRNYMRHMTGTVYAIMPGRVNFDRGTQMAGIIKDESRHDPSRGFAGGYEMETLPGFGLAGVASNTIAGAWGPEYAKVIESTIISPACGSSARTCRRRATASCCMPRKRTSTGCRCRWCTSRTTPTTLPCATTPTRRERRSTSRSAPRRCSSCRHSPARTTWAPAARARRRRTGCATSTARPTMSPICSSRTAASLLPAAPRTRR